MALRCIVQTVPKYAQASGKYFCCLNLSRTASMLSSTRFNNTIEPLTTCSTAVKLSPSCLNKVIDLSQVKAFSVSSSKSAATGHDHTKLWSAERLLSVGLLGLTPAAFLYPCCTLDSLLAITLVMHNHWGIEAVVIDYVRPSIFGDVIPKVGLGLTYGLSIATLVGLFYLIFHGAGLVNTIQLFWKI